MKSFTAFPFLFKRKIPFKDSYGEAQTEKTQREGMRVEERETFAELAPPPKRPRTTFIRLPLSSNSFSSQNAKRRGLSFLPTPPTNQPGCLFKKARVSVLNCFSRPVCSVPRSCKAQSSQRGDIIPKPPGHTLYSAFWRTRAGR